MTFAPKSQLARKMIERAAAAKMRSIWGAGDAVYGGATGRCGWLEQQHTAYVLAVACDYRVPVGAGQSKGVRHIRAP